MYTLFNHKKVNPCELTFVYLTGLVALQRPPEIYPVQGPVLYLVFTPLETIRESPVLWTGASLRSKRN